MAPFLRTLFLTLALAIWPQIVGTAFASDDDCRSVLPAVSTELRRPGSGAFGMMANRVTRQTTTIRDLLLLRHLESHGILVQGSRAHVSADSLGGSPDPRVFLLFEGNSPEPVHLIPRPEMGSTHAYLRSGDRLYPVELNLSAPDLAPYRAEVAPSVSPKALKSAELKSLRRFGIR